MKNLQNSNYFKDVRLKVIKQEEVSNLPLRKFEITSKMDFIGKQKAPEKEKKEEEVSNNKNEKQI